MDEKLQQVVCWVKDITNQTKSISLTQTMSRDSKRLFYGGILSCILMIWLVIKTIQYLNNRRSTMMLPQTPQLEKFNSTFKAPSRKPGGTTGLALHIELPEVVLT